MIADAARPAIPASSDRPRLFIVMMGVCGSGKSVVGRRLAECLGLPFIEGDELHPPANVAKMSSGIPLTDEDRWPWLDAIADALNREGRLAAGAVAACSALKRIYRDRLRSRTAQPVRFVLLDGPRRLLENRMKHRSGHFMPASLLESQLRTLERPGADEAALRLDIRHSISALVEEAASALQRVPSG
jgi:gluconokinase